MLAINNIEVTYSDVILVLRGISLQVAPGQIVALLGANGAGKTTTLKAISGLLVREDGAVSRGSVTLHGERLDRLPPAEVTRRGVAPVLEGRRVFEHLTVAENLRAGALVHGDRAATRRLLAGVYDYFPALARLRDRTAGYLSGGEQQMVVIGRALMAQPRVLLLDEPSLGLAPQLAAQIFAIIRRIRTETETAVLLVEQNARAALRVADYGYVLENGRIVLDGPAAELANNADVKEFYLGLTQVGQRKSYRDVKHYRRRKRWLG